MSRLGPQVIKIDELTGNPHLALALLKHHLPASIAIYRRIQSMRVSEHTHIYASASTAQQEATSCVAVAFVDRSLRPETELYLFLKHQTAHLNETCHKCSQIVLAMLKKVANLPVEKRHSSSASQHSRFSAHLQQANLALAGSIDHYAASLIDKLGLLDPGFPGMNVPYAKYIFCRKRLAVTPQILPFGLVWGTMTKTEDLELVISRTEIPRQLKTLAALQSVGVFKADTTQPIAWGFIGVDASLSSLHVEGQWRGKGIAKLIAARLVEASCGDDGVGHADVGLDNTASRRVLESIGGTDEERVYWLRIDLAKVLSSKSAT